MVYMEHGRVGEARRRFSPAWGVGRELGIQRIPPLQAAEGVGRRRRWSALAREWEVGAAVADHGG